ncbi:MAG: hypothetical protein LBI57_07775 [Helicobacteraceae bacterium]|jgi:hypothetical protein|nr:hypothetical protein [Helicobacteraceae bacterium]
MNRRAVALLIALVFIAAMLGFAALFFQRTNRAFARVAQRDAAIQTNSILFHLSNSVLGELVQAAKSEANAICALAEDKNDCREKALIEIYKVFYSLPLAFETGGAYTNVKCSPAGLKLNINSLKIPDGIDDNNRNQPVFRIRDRVDRFLRDRYGLYASWQLFELMDFVFDANGTKNVYLGKDTRLNVAKPNMERGRIGSLQKLRAIAEDYVALAKDESVFAIPWDQFFEFESPVAALDYNYMDQKACELAFYDTPGACDRRDEWTYEADLIARFSDANQTINDFSVKFGFNPSMSCRVNYTSGANVFGYAFYYDANSRKLSGFRVID